MACMLGSGTTHFAVRVVAVGILASMSACAASGEIRVANPMSVNMRGYQLVGLMVQAANPADEAEARMLGDWLMQQLPPAGIRLVDHRLRPDVPADVGIAIAVLQVRRVTQTERILVGGLAGRAGLVTHVRVVEIATRRVLGEATIEGKSSGGTVFAGTTEQAVREAGSAIAGWLLGAPPPQ